MFEWRRAERYLNWIPFLQKELVSCLLGKMNDQDFDKISGGISHQKVFRGEGS